MNYKTKTMKLLITTLFIFSLSISTVFAQKQYKITAEFENIKHSKGSLFVALYNKEGSFLKKQFKGEIVEIKNQKAIVVFENIPEGTYAISSFHDENDNKKMDTNFFGIPKEPIGISNNAKGFMGPPKFKDAKFQLTENKHLKIKMN